VVLSLKDRSNLSFPEASSDRADTDYGFDALPLRNISDVIGDLGLASFEIAQAEGDCGQARAACL